jgi:hypothetical protein
MTAEIEVKEIKFKDRSQASYRMDILFHIEADRMFIPVMVEVDAESVDEGITIARKRLNHVAAAIVTATADH